MYWLHHQSITIGAYHLCPNLPSHSLSSQHTFIVKNWNWENSPPAVREFCQYSHSQAINTFYKNTNVSHTLSCVTCFVHRTAEEIFRMFNQWQRHGVWIRRRIHTHKQEEPTLVCPSQARPDQQCGAARLPRWCQRHGLPSWRHGFFFSKPPPLAPHWCDQLLTYIQIVPSFW